MMETNKTQIAARDLCYNCKHGGAVVEQCNCPDLSEPTAWQRIIPRTWSNANIVGRAMGMAEAKGIKDYSPTPYLAVTAAVMNGKCKYFSEQQPNLFAE